MRGPFCLCGAVMLAGSALTLYGQGKVVEKDYRVSGRAALQLHADDGSITGSSCGNCSTVHIKVDFHDADPSRYEVKESQSGNTIHFELKHKPMSNWSHGWSRGPELTVLLPTNADTQLSTGSGSVALSQIHGKEDLESGSGNIRAEAIDGSLRANTGSGGLQLRGIHGALDAESSSGSIEADGTVALHGATTGSGGIHLALAPGSTIQNGAKVESGSGSIEIRMASSTQVDLHAETGSGVVHCDLPVSDQGEQNRQTLHGKLNGGGPTLNVTTGSGSITLHAL